MALMRYLKREFQWSMFGLQHEPISDLYLGSFQKNRATLPLLCIRSVVFFGCLGTLITSMVMTAQSVGYGYWWIFLTHWGLLVNTLASFLAFELSIRAVYKGSIDGSSGLPYYAKGYWTWYNSAVPIAFFITLFYWSMLTDEEYEISKTLDVFIHGINSVLMFILVVTNRHPTRILHFYFSVIFGTVYLIFSIIFHYAGGIGPFGTSAVYPMLDWAEPGVAAITAVGSAVGIIVMHLVHVAIAVARDALTKSCRDSSTSAISITTP